MKKTVTWISIITFVILIIDWGVMGVKLLNHNYDIIAEAYIGLICWLILIIFSVHKFFTTRCPHCNKILLTKGKYCSHCGKER